MELTGLDRALAKKAGSKRMTESMTARRSGQKMLDKLNARRMAKGRENSKLREQLRQQIRFVVTSSVESGEKQRQLKKLTDEAKKLNIPKEKLKLWLGQDTKSHFIYVDGPDDLFALLEIVDTNYNADKIRTILRPLVKARKYEKNLKNSWDIEAPGKRSGYLEYVGRVMVESDEGEEGVMEIGLEIDALDVLQIDETHFWLKVAPTALADTEMRIRREFNTRAKVLESELTHVAANPIELDEEVAENVELFEETIQAIIAQSDIHMELAGVYFNVAE